MTQLNFLWQGLDIVPKLLTHQVHLWCASLEQSSDKVCQLAQTLSADESARANRFRFRQHQENFVVSRGFLRQILSRYLNLEATELQFFYNKNGKPFLANTLTENRLSFNLSHSGKVVLYAMVWNDEIGIDVEEIKFIPEFEGLIKNFFADEEKETILSLEPNQRLQAFFHGWTRKEAYLKAVGTGLSLSPADIQVSLESTKEAKLLKISGDSQIALKWCLKSLAPAEGYVGAIAIPNQQWHFEYHQWVG
jgi:4'-phosphopantetheinyl transferase